MIRKGTILRLATSLCCLTLSGCDAIGHGFLSPAGPIADAERHYFLVVCLILVFVIAPVLILTPIIAWHYRLNNTHSAYRPQWGFNWPLEGLIWIPPTAIVVGLAVLLWRDTHRLDPYRPLPSTTAALEVQVVALDWKWLFIYPDQHVATVNELVIPAGQPVHLRLTSGTVMQALLMPRLASQIYAMAGMTTQLNFAADRPGDYWGENTQFNGVGFQNQKFTVSARTPEAFQQWLVSIQAQQNRLDVSAYQKLSVRSTLLHPLRFGAVAPGLFDGIVQQAFPSGHILHMKASQNHG
jgi:cytochrome o ubiquinol oxidase subunit 2